MIYYISFLLSVSYFLWLAIPYIHHFQTGIEKPLLTWRSIAFALDLFILACAIANIIMGVRDYLGLVQSPLPSLVMWGLFSAAAVHRITEITEAIDARIAAQGENA